MNMVPVDDFLPLLRSMVTNGISLDMKTALVQAAITFCRKSKAILHVREVDLVYAGTTISIVEKSGVNRRTPGAIKSSEILSMTENGNPLVPDVDYLVTGLDSVKFKRDIGRVEFVAIVEPQTGTKYLPAVLVTDWCDVICHGAASILDSKNSGPERQLTSFHEREFTEGIRRAYRWRVEASPSVNPVPRRQRRREFF